MSIRKQSGNAFGRKVSSALASIPGVCYEAPIETQIYQRISLASLTDEIRIRAGS
jgi:hypothetical protein